MTDTSRTITLDRTDPQPAVRLFSDGTIEVNDASPTSPGLAKMINARRCESIDLGGDYTMWIDAIWIDAEGVTGPRRPFINTAAGLLCAEYGRPETSPAGTVAFTGPTDRDTGEVTPLSGREVDRLIDRLAVLRCQFTTDADGNLPSAVAVEGALALYEYLRRTHTAEMAAAIANGVGGDQLLDNDGITVNHEIVRDCASAMTEYMST